MRFEPSKGAKFHNKGKFKMTKEQKPTIGRIVNYVVENDYPAAAGNAEVVPAMITKCNEDGSVNLHVMANESHPDGTAVVLMRFNVVDWSTGGGHWQWPVIEKQETEKEKTPVVPSAESLENATTAKAEGKKDEKEAVKPSKNTTPETEK
jgi:hypothetical protein